MAQCDGEWEHDYGIKIETLDNPGWLVSIDLLGTDLEDKSFPTIAQGVGAKSNPRSPTWIHCC